MSPLYPDLYEFEDFGSLPMDGSEAIGLFMGIYLIFMVLSMAYSVLVYILHSLGTYSIAKRRGIHHAWMSWISPPVYLDPWQHLRPVSVCGQGPGPQPS